MTEQRTIAVRVPDDLYDDLQTLMRREGATELTQITRRLLREGADVELKHGHGRLFDPSAGAARPNDPKTAKDAAELKRPTSGSSRWRVLALYQERAEDRSRNPHVREGLNADEVCQLLEGAGYRIAVNGIAKRVSELAQAGALTEARDTANEIITRRTRNQREATVYVITPKGRRWLKEEAQRA